MFNVALVIISSPSPSVPPAPSESIYKKPFDAVADKKSVKGVPAWIELLKVGLLLIVHAVGSVPELVIDQ